MRSLPSFRRTHARWHLGAQRGRSGNHGELPEVQDCGAAASSPFQPPARGHHRDESERRQQNPELDGLRHRQDGAGSGQAGPLQRRRQSHQQDHHLRGDHEAAAGRPSPDHQGVLPADRGDLGAHRARGGPRPVDRQAKRPRHLHFAEQRPAGRSGAGVPGPRVFRCLLGGNAEIGASGPSQEEARGGQRGGPGREAAAFRRPRRVRQKTLMVRIGKDCWWRQSNPSGYWI